MDLDNTESTVKHKEPYYYLDTYGTSQSCSGQLSHTFYQQPSSSSITLPPRIPATSFGPSGRLNTEAREFVPKATLQHKAITIRSLDGTEVDLESLKKRSHQPSTAPILPVSSITKSHQMASVKVESEEDKRKRQEKVRLKQEKKSVAAQMHKAAEEKNRQRLEEVEQKFKEVAIRIEQNELVGRLEEQTHGPSPPPPAVIMARNINRLDEIEYPPGIKRPNAELNKYATDGKFRYDRDFLLQFMHICREKPPHLPPLAIFGIEPVDQASFAVVRGGSGRHLRASSGSSVTGSQSASAGNSGGFKPCAPLNPFMMGQFSTPSNKLTSEERFSLSSGSLQVSGGSDATVSAPSNRLSMAWTPSPGESEYLVDRKREKSTNPCESALEDPDSSADSLPTFPYGSVAPLQIFSNDRMPTSTQSKAIGTGTRGIVVEDIKGLLAKLTVEKFDYISDQIVACINASENVNDDQTLVEVAALIIEKASAEANRSEMYARLSVKMVQSISHKVPNHGINGSDSKPIAGGQLFRRNLLNRCQDESERWIFNETSSHATAFKANNGGATSEEGDGGELYSDKYYTAQRSKRHSLGLIKFIGELFKLQILTERIMHEYVKKLLGDVKNPGEERLEGLCQLLGVIGQMLDIPKARAHMDVYFSRMKELVRNDNVSPQVRAMLQDVIELRERKWQPHNVASVPITLAPVHETASMSRRWATGPPPTAGDLSQFGKIKPTLVMGPGSVFAGKNKHELFSTVSSNPDPTSHPRTRSFAPLENQNHRLFPQANPIPGDLTYTASHIEPEGALTAQMTEVHATKKINACVKEFFTVRRQEETDGCFTGLPKKHRFRLVAKLVTSALEGKEEDARLVAEFFARPTSQREWPHTFEAGFVAMAETLDDIVIDAPKAFEYIAIMLKGAGLDRDKERLTRIAKKVMNSDKSLQFVMHNLSTSAPSASSLLNTALSTMGRPTYFGADIGRANNLAYPRLSGSPPSASWVSGRMLAQDPFAYDMDMEPEPAGGISPSRMFRRPY